MAGETLFKINVGMATAGGAPLWNVGTRQEGALGDQPVIKIGDH
jgi:hypothetical protein